MFRIDALRRKLVCELGITNPSPPKGRRYSIAIHVFHLQKGKRKSLTEKNSMPRLLTMIRGNEILRVLKSKKGFRAATFGGFFLLGQMLLFLFHSLVSLKRVES
jgi:hypothetical protein